MWYRRQTKNALCKSKDTIQTRLKEFNFDIANPVRAPSPTYRGKPNIYPGRLWRLEWGEMEEPFTPNGTFQPMQTKVAYSIIGPGPAAARSPSYKRAYF